MSGVWNDFLTLWTGMGMLPAVFLALGFVLVIIEMFNPGLGIFGGLGGVLIVLGIVLRVMDSDSLTQSLAHLFMLVFIILLFFTIIFLLIVRFTKYGWISQSSMVNNDVSANIAADSLDGINYTHLVGQGGVSLTSLHPSGKVFINGNNYDVVTRGDFIEANIEIRVREVEGVRIVVERK